RSERAEIAGRDRREIRVGGRRRGALVLAELGSDLVRRDDVHAGMTPPQLVRDRALVRRIPKREQEAHGDGVDLAHVRDLPERLELAAGAETSAHAVAALERDERLRMLRAQAIEMRTRLP